MRRCLITLALAVFVSSIAVATASAADMSYAHWEESGNEQPEASLWVADADGGNARKVPNSEGASRSSISPDGQSVVYEKTTYVNGYSFMFLYVTKIDGSEAYPIAMWGSTPDWSPDGRHIVFTGGYPADIWVIDSDGGNPHAVAANSQHEHWPSYTWDGKDIVYQTSGMDGVSIYRITAAGTNKRTVWGGPFDYENNFVPWGPRYSPDGERIAVQSYTKDGPSQIFTLGADGSGPSKVTDDSGYNHGHAVYRADGRLAYDRTPIWDGSSVYSCPEIHVEGGGKLVDGCAVAPSFRKPPLYTRATDGELLARHDPILRYDGQETYIASSAGMMTDNYAGNRGRANLLKRGQTILAAPGPIRPPNLAQYPTLNLGYLGYPLYGDSSTALEGDNIDAANTYAIDAQRMQYGDYGNRTYGRVFRDPSGEVVVQYWLFYYYNPKSYAGFGVHEGDWEMVQVELDTKDNPVRATYSQHGWGERCDWRNVQSTEGRPIVYVAEGSHASYFSSGFHFNEGSWDTAGGNGSVASPSIDAFSAPGGWTDWPGRWGGSGSSPTSPKIQGGDKWNNPLAWSAGVHDCTEDQIQSSSKKRGVPPNERYRAPAAAPPAPSIAALRSGDEAIVDYRIPESKGKQRDGWQLLLSVKANGRYAPLTTRVDLRGRKGRVTVPLGAGRPRKVLASVVATNGARSRTVGVELRD